MCPCVCVCVCFSTLRPSCSWQVSSQMFWNVCFENERLLDFLLSQFGYDFYLNMMELNWSFVREDCLWNCALHCASLWWTALISYFVLCCKDETQCSLSFQMFFTVRPWPASSLIHAQHSMWRVHGGSREDFFIIQGLGGWFCIDCWMIHSVQRGFMHRIVYLVSTVHRMKTILD